MSLIFEILNNESPTRRKVPNNKVKRHILQDLAMHKIKVWGKIVAINELSALLMLLKWLCQVKLQQNIETQRNSARHVLFIVGC